MPVDDDSQEFTMGESSEDEEFVHGAGMSSFYQGEELLGDTANPKMKYIMDRLTRNIIEWRSTIQEAPSDEVRAHNLLHEKVETTRKVKAQLRKDSVYNSRINKVKSDERKALILHHIKVDNVHTAAEITRVTGLHRTTVVRLLVALESAGRLVSHSEGRDRIYEVA
jgi:predicted HTH transcriptional regulator